ncbi:hypothetical protein J2X85_000456 [Microbacterium trichothecenolyticum]|uniref:hypothetical protein n=1 Tax=Microbacterium trichothecenolyticum TaxID=69370 RepID=UPI00285F89F5|nr:hypothetical protein [Microbacterium trichothecenolyticum]MDR7183433.1 hypothetical protein [Microbacterium trichothecenolyticum]
MRSRASAVLALLSIVVLAGCSPTTLPEFESAQTDRDILVDAASQDVDADSTRFVGEVEGADIYLARGTDDTLCLIQIRDGEWEHTGCGAGLGIGSTLATGTRIEAGTFTFPDDEVAGGKRTRLSDSVTVISYP